MSKRKIISYWKTSFERAGVRAELIESYMGYINPLVAKEVPIIFDFDHLSLLLGRSKTYLASVINSNVSHYRSFKIPKRNGGERTITSPYPALMECQIWIYENILKKIKIHPAAQGFTFRKSIITNATIHLEQAQFLKIDLKDFFPSIKINEIITVFKSLGYTHRVSFYLAAICCYGEELPQGAPTSPMISNIVASHLDNRLFKFSKRFNLKYTRYADDLAFSGENIPIKFLEYISNIVEESGFLINEKKTVLQKKKGKRILTGISIAESTLLLPRDYKRKLKQELHYILRFGVISHIRKRKIRNPNYTLSIIGKLRFWLSVEPDNSFAQNALLKLNSEK
jgi:RNA-directed DNA polymerase